MILRVFIVEDEEMIRKGLVHTINWAGMGCLVVGSAADGRSGLSSILQKRPDVVITDIRMPEMDGLEMLERALAVYSFRIILLTSYADFDYARRAISLRACDYLLKPLDEEIVLKAAKECGKVITAEEHSVIGGLGDAVADVLMGKVNCKFHKIGVNDRFGQPGKAADVLREYGLTADQIAETVKANI